MPATPRCARQRSRFRAARGGGDPGDRPARRPRASRAGPRGDAPPPCRRIPSRRPSSSERSVRPCNGALREDAHLAERRRHRFGRDPPQAVVVPEAARAAEARAALDALVRTRACGAERARALRRRRAEDSDVGSPSAPATCMAPESLRRTLSASARSATSSPTDVSPAATSAPRGTRTRPRGSARAPTARRPGPTRRRAPPAGRRAPPSVRRHFLRGPVGGAGRERDQPSLPAAARAEPLLHARAMRRMHVGRDGLRGRLDAEPGAARGGGTSALVRPLDVRRAQSPAS
jgi:hypothetical protein